MLVPVGTHGVSPFGVKVGRGVANGGLGHGAFAGSPASEVLYGAQELPWRRDDGVIIEPAGWG